MLSLSQLAVLALSTLTVVARPKAQWANYGHKHLHSTGDATATGSHNHNGTYDAAAAVTTEWITLTVYPVDSSTTLVTSTTASVVKQNRVCKGPQYNQTVTSTSTSTIYVTVPAPESTTNTTTVTTTVEITTTVPAAATTTTEEATSTTTETPVYTVDATYITTTTTAAATVATGAGQFYGTASESTSAAASTGASTYSTAKKGLSFTTANVLNMFTGASWAYNWGLSPASGATMPSGVEFIPMCWGTASAADCPESVKNAVTKYGSTAVLSFNEPDNAGQANISPSVAYTNHVQYIAPLKGTVKIGSPAVTNSQSSGQGLDWMKQFLELCQPSGQSDSCNLDFLALHWYNDVSTFSDFKNHIQQANALAAQYGISSVWITEFAATGGTTADQAAFLTQAVEWLQSSDPDAQKVERYAYFLAGPVEQGLGMVTNSALNAIGEAYNSIA